MLWLCVRVQDCVVGSVKGRGGGRFQVNLPLCALVRPNVALLMMILTGHSKFTVNPPQKKTVRLKGAPARADIKQKTNWCRSLDPLCTLLGIALMYTRAWLSGKSGRTFVRVVTYYLFVTLRFGITCMDAGGGGTQTWKWRTSAYQRTKVWGIRCNISLKKGGHSVWAPKKWDLFYGSHLVWKNATLNQNLQILC